MTINNSICFAEETQKVSFKSYYNHRQHYNKRPIKLLGDAYNKYKPSMKVPTVLSMVKGTQNLANQLSPIKPFELEEKDSLLLIKPEKALKDFADFNKSGSRQKETNTAPKAQPNNKTKQLYDASKVETTVITLRINDKIAYDFEVIIWPDDTISVPIKTLAEFLDVVPEQNHVTNNISFVQPVTKQNVSIDHTKNTILLGTDLIDVQNPRLVFVKQGFIVQDEIFVPQELAQKLLDVKTNFAKSNCLMQLDTSNVLKAFLEINEANQKPDDIVISEPVKEIKQEAKENKKFKVKRFDYNVGSSMNRSSSYGSASSNGAANVSFNSSGNLLGGEYNLGASTYYGQNGLVVGGYRASLDYMKPKYEVSLGATNTRLSNIAVPGSNIWGVRFGSVGAANGSSTVPRLINGLAENNSYVELFVNNMYTDKQLVQNGQFEFDSLNYPFGSTVKIRVEQVTPDGKRTVVYDRKFSQDKDLLAPGQSQFLVFSGIDGTSIGNSISLFGDKFNYNYVQPMKFLSGSKFRYGLSDNLTMGVNIAKDIIIRQPSRNFIQEVKDVTSSRYSRTGITSSGQIASVDLSYLPTKNLRINSEVGISRAMSKLDEFYDPNGSDVGGFVGIDYVKDSFSVSAKAFSFGPDFYSPGSNGMIDKRGIEINPTWRVGPIEFSGGLTRYNSNLDNYFPGGQTQIMDYNLNVSGKIDDKSDIMFGVRSTGTSNATFVDKERSFDVTIKRRINNKTNLTLNYGKTYRKYMMPGSITPNNSSNHRLNAELSYDADKLGVIRLSHEMLMLDPVERLYAMELNPIYFEEPVYSKNIRLSLDRSHLPIKGFTVSPNVGYRYGGDNKGLNYGLNLGYVFKRGRQVVLSYAYNSTFAKYMPGSFSFGGNNYHTFSFNFYDSLDFLGTKNLGVNKSYQTSFDANNGVIKGCVFIDLNNNGIKDPDETGLPGVDISVHGLYDITTDKDGNYIAANIPQGTRKVGISKASLPVIYAPSVSQAVVNVKPQKVYVANLGVSLTPGSVSGKIKISKEDVSNSDVVILLLDKSGREVKYTTSDSKGEYYIEGISPGEYSLIIDKNYLDYKGLENADSSEHKFNIPVIIDDFVEVAGIDFSLIPKHGKLKQFNE